LDITIFNKPSVQEKAPSKAFPPIYFHLTQDESIRQ